METGRSKRPESDMDGKKVVMRRTRLRSEEGDRRVAEEEEEEVEEEEEKVEVFFTIIRRMHNASRYFGLSNGYGCNKAREERGGSSRWRPTFRLEDFQVAHGVQGEEKKAHTDKGRRRDERVAENGIHGCLDLNVEPGPNSDVVVISDGGPVPASTTAT